MNYIKVHKKNNYIDLNNKDFIIINGKSIKNKEDLLLPFFKKFKLNDYIGTYSLDTFEYIISDNLYLNTDKIRIIIVDFNILLIDDKKRKKDFLNILTKCLLIDNGITYNVDIFL